MGFRLSSKYSVLFVLFILLVSIISAYALDNSFSSRNSRDKITSNNSKDKIISNKEIFKKNSEAYVHPNQYKKGNFYPNGDFACTLNSDCGIDSATDPYCYNGNVYQQFKNYLCLNPGTPLATCTFSTDTKLTQECSQNQTCSNGSCQNIQIACTNNSDCGNDDYFGNLFCSNGDVFQQFKTYSCYKPGTADASCSSSNQNKLKLDCAQNELCDNGECKSLACNKNSDCGTDSAGEPYCSNGNVYQQTKNYICNNAGTIFANCANSTNTELVQNCKPDETCENGECKNIACSKDSDCEDVIGTKFCNQNDAYANVAKQTCENAGTIQAYCSVDSVSGQLMDDCSVDETCIIGECQPLECTKDSDCGENGACVAGKCKATACVFSDDCGPFHDCIDSECVLLEGFCNTDAECGAGEKCIENKCESIGCYSDDDCTADGYLGNPYCNEFDVSNVFQQYINHACINAGKYGSYCKGSIVEKEVEACDPNEVCYEENFKAGCHVKSEIEDVECFSMADCPQSWDNLSCNGNSVVGDFQYSICYAAGTKNSFCGDTQIIEDKKYYDCSDALGQVCSSGKCITPKCFSDDDCTKVQIFGKYIPAWAMFPFLQYSCQSPGTAEAKCVAKATKPQTIAESVINKIIKYKP